MRSSKQRSNILPQWGPGAGTAMSITAIWIAVILTSIFAPDLIHSSTQEHLPIAAITWWFWGLISTAFVLFAVAVRRHEAAAKDPLWFAFAAAISAIWLVAMLLSIFTERHVTGADPTQFPVAAVFSPFVAMVATGFMAGLVARLYSEQMALAVVTIVVLVGISLVSLLVLAMPEPVRATAPADQFSSGRALRHLEAIARAPSPTGSAQNALVRDYIIDEIRALGLTPEIQSTVAVHPESSMAFQVDNVLLRLPGSDSSRAMLIVGHYDGIASGPGAGDNRLSNAAMLEAIRTLQAREQLRNDIIFLFPDAEEYGLVGANAFIEEHPWAMDIGVVFNYDASTGRGSLVLMKTAGEDGWLVSNLDAANAGIFLKSQQNSERDDEPWGTDFDAFRKAGYTAADINNWANQAYYHTPLDNIENLDEGKLQAYGDSIVQLAKHFGNIDLRETREGDRVFTSMFDKDFVVGYPKSWTWPLAIVATAGVAVVLAIGIRRGRLGGIALASSTVALLALLISGAVLAGVAWSVIEGMHAEAQWQQEGDIYQGALLLGGLVGFVAAGFIAFLAWGRQHLGVPNLQAAVLILGAVIVVAFTAADPFFSYVALWPILAVTIAVGVSFFIPEGETGRYRWLRAGVFWLAAIPVLGVVIPLLWRSLVNSTEPGAAVPVFVLIFLAALLVSSIDIVLPSRRLWLPGVAVVAGVALLALGTARSDFNADQPRPHTLFYAMNADTSTAKWATLDDNPDEWIAQFVPKATAEATTAESVLGITASTLEGSDWLIPSVNAWISDAPLLDSPPPELEVLEDRRDGDVRTLRLRVTSQRGGRVVSIAPEQEVVRASVEGKPINVYPGWRFVFVGMPVEGLELEVVLGGQGPSRLTVLDQTDGLPPSVASRYSPEPEDMMPAILPRWARGYPTFVIKTYLLQ